MKLSDLIEKLEAATEGSRELTTRIIPMSREQLEAEVYEMIGGVAA